MKNPVYQRIEDNLRIEELLALLGIARSLRSQMCTIIHEAFEEYKKICRNYSIKPRGKATFRKYIYYFVRLNLINVEPIKNKAEQGRFLKISLVKISPSELTKFLNSIIKNHDFLKEEKTLNLSYDKIVS